ncbi:Cupin domain protein [Geodermatophilus pulveris]|uniref:Cupin domain protein n=1 Tax=Geodermatophilus pulveris TaxID=1564159 RepID=A0A239CM79_9ACTN|nr:cupin domain-containing protein [Geodermatophilus pulveris]SNS21255.1 Cupin domain protein [Geodermatophilus pulveris]
MTYPAPRHLGPGVATAALRPGSAGPDLRFTRGGAVHHLATQASTGGDYGLFRWDMAAAPSGPEPHFHRGMSEAFYVLEGTVALFDGRRWTDAVPGDFLHVPPGGVHAFRNESGAPASMLMLFTPGAPRESYFAELEEIAARGRTLTGQQWTELYARHDQVMVDVDTLPGHRRG